MTDQIDLEMMMNNVRARTPLIHCITNYVTVNDCANILLACGGSPIMSDAAEEVEEMTSICDGLDINIGTLNQRTIRAMLLAGKRANALNHPVLLDPAGVGATRLRTETTKHLVREIQFAAIRGNVSEIRAMAQETTTTRGVDVSAEDAINADNIDRVIDYAMMVAQQTGAVTGITGATDIVTDGGRICLIANGHPIMSRVTGTGCTLSAMTAAYIAANPERIFEAVCAAFVVNALCGELAFARMSEKDGIGSFRVYLIDAIGSLSAEQLKAGARYSIMNPGFRTKNGCF